VYATLSVPHTLRFLLHVHILITERTQNCTAPLLVLRTLHLLLQIHILLAESTLTHRGLAHCGDHVFGVSNSDLVSFAVKDPQAPAEEEPNVHNHRNNRATQARNIHEQVYVGRGSQEETGQDE